MLNIVKIYEKCIVKCIADCYNVLYNTHNYSCYEEEFVLLLLLIYFLWVSSEVIRLCIYCAGDSRSDS